MPVTLGTLLLGNSRSNTGYTLFGSTSNALTLNNWGYGATITVAGGNHAINAPVILADNLSVVPGSAKLWSLSFGTAEQHYGQWRRLLADHERQRRHADPQRQQQLQRRHDSLPGDSDVLGQGRATQFRNGYGGSWSDPRSWRWTHAQLLRGNRRSTTYSCG